MTPPLMILVDQNGNVAESQHPRRRVRDRTRRLATAHSGHGEHSARRACSAISCNAYRCVTRPSDGFADRRFRGRGELPSALCDGWISKSACYDIACHRPADERARCRIRRLPIRSVSLVPGIASLVSSPTRRSSVITPCRRLRESSSVLPPSDHSPARRLKRFNPTPVSASGRANAGTTGLAPRCNIGPDATIWPDQFF